MGVFTILDTKNWGLFFLKLNRVTVTTGDLKPTLKTAADDGWVLMDTGSIGSAGSGATNRANADTAALYILIWTNVSNTAAPVAGGRGASAAADFAANKAMGLPALTAPATYAKYMVKL